MLSLCGNVTYMKSEKICKVLETLEGDGMHGDHDNKACPLCDCTYSVIYTCCGEHLGHPDSALANSMAEVTPHDF